MYERTIYVGETSKSVQKIFLGHDTAGYSGANFIKERMMEEHGTEETESTFKIEYIKKDRDKMRRLIREYVRINEAMGGNMFE